MASPQPSDRTRRAPDRPPPSRIERRRQKIAEEIERNRRGEYRVPTWVLAAALVLIVGGWLALIFLS
jgi:hypothetical protein